MNFPTRRMVSLIAVLLAHASGCGGGGVPLSKNSFVQCNDTITCQAQMRERDHAFARAVADEPLANRVSVEVISRVALFNPNRQTIYVLDPKFIALESQTGKERFHLEGVSGSSLSRAGMWLVVFNDGAKQPQLTFIDPAKPQDKPISCSPKVPIPAEAEDVYVLPFDRAGQPYFYWQSSYSYRGGTPPGREIEAREERAEACGIMKIDVPSCAVQSVSLDDFLWDPPEGRRQSAGIRHFCGFLSPLRDIPAAAASAPPPMGGYGQLAPATRAPIFLVRSEREPGNGCRQVTHLTLEARSESSSILWEHPLAPIESFCGPP